MKVWIVLSILEDNSTSILAVFASEAAADAFDNQKPVNTCIEEHTVFDLAGGEVEP